MKNNYQENGFTFVMVLIVILVVGILVAALINSSIFNTKFSAIEMDRSRAYFAAQSGIQHLKADIDNILVKTTLSGEEIINNNYLNYENEEAEYYVINKKDNDGLLKEYISTGKFNGIERRIKISYIDSNKFSGAGPIQMYDNENYTFNGNVDGENYVTKLDEGFTKSEWDILKGLFEILDDDTLNKDQLISDNIYIIDFSQGQEEFDFAANMTISNSIIIASGATENNPAEIVFPGVPTIKIENSIFIIDKYISITVNGTGGLDWPTIEDYNNGEIEIGTGLEKFRAWSLVNN